MSLFPPSRDYWSLECASRPALTWLSWDTYFSGVLQKNGLFLRFPSRTSNVDFAYTARLYVKPDHPRPADLGVNLSNKLCIMYSQTLRNVIALTLLKRQNALSVSLKRAEDFTLTYCWVCVALGIFNSLIAREQHAWAAPVLPGYGIALVPPYYSPVLDSFTSVSASSFLLTCINSLQT